MQDSLAAANTAAGETVHDSLSTPASQPSQEAAGVPTSTRSAEATLPASDMQAGVSGHHSAAACELC